MTNRSRVVVIGNPITNLSSGKFLVKFCHVLSTITAELHVVNDGADAFRPRRARVIPATRALAAISQRRMLGLGPATRFLGAQLCLAIGLLKCLRRTDLVILFPVVMLLPAIVVKFSRKPLLLYEAQDVFFERPSSKSRFTALSRFGFMFLLRCAVIRLADGIIVEGESVIAQNGLENFKKKTYCWHQPADTQNYVVRRPFSARDQVVGFLATLDKRKGILEFAMATHLVRNQRATVRFVIGGEGPMREVIQEDLAELIGEGTAQVIGAVPESAICDFYNQLTLYVLPSTSEGLPNSILESMACGTPVVATAVGAVPDVINDGKTGFLMKNNNPKVIAATILRALDDPSLGLISERARARMEKEFSFRNSAEVGAEVIRRAGRLEKRHHAKLTRG